jgi:hypothetical protein
MAKKAVKKKTKPKAQYGWVYSPTATEADKIAISIQFEPVVAELKKHIQPLPEPQEWNHCVDVFTKWHRNYFYIMQKYKTGKNAIVDYFDTGLARVEFYGKDRFNLSYFRHTGQWEPLPMYHNISFEDAQKAILNDEWFMMF